MADKKADTTKKKQAAAKKPAIKATVAPTAAEAIRKKRRLNTAPTLREQVEKNAKKQGKPSRLKKFTASKLFIPFREIGIVFKLVWRSRIFRPIRATFRFIGRILAPKYVRNSFGELRYVTWPGFVLSWKLTFAVLLFAICVGLLISGLDFVFEKLFKEVLLGL